MEVYSIIDVGNHVLGVLPDFDHFSSETCEAPSALVTIFVGWGTCFAAVATCSLCCLDYPTLKLFRLCTEHLNKQV